MQEPKIRTSHNSVRPFRAVFIPLFFLVLFQIGLAQPGLPISSIANHQYSMSVSRDFDPRGFQLGIGQYATAGRSAAKDHLSFLAPSATCNDRWLEGAPVNGVDGSVFAIAVDASGNTYVGGSFRIAGSSFANNIAKWDGTS